MTHWLGAEGTRVFRRDEEDFVKTQLPSSLWKILGRIAKRSRRRARRYTMMT